MVKVFGRQFSDAYGVPRAWLATNGIFDPTLDIDAPLFIDPFLIPYSRHPEFSGCAWEAYEAHFGTIFGLLRLSEEEGDKAWVGALAKFQLGEKKGMHGLCLGYSKRSNRGHGFGPGLSRQSLRWAKAVIDLGVKDPELFSSLPLFESGIGPDLISDMTANIALRCIVKFNARVISEIRASGISIPSQVYPLQGLEAELVPNPFDNSGYGVVLLPSDVLKHLPTLEDPTLLPKVAESNAELRGRVNEHIGEVFKIRFKNEKDRIARLAMKNAASFQAMLDLLKLLERTPYDLLKDPEGLMQWRAEADKATDLFKVKITDDSSLPRLQRIDSIVIQIISQFKKLVEENRLNRVFYVDQEPRHERFAQLLFFAIASSYCEANDLDVSPESDAGAGPVDFKFSSGKQKVVVEIKLSTNGHTVSGYRKQLDAYMAAEDSGLGHYVLVNVGRLGNKWKDLQKIHRSDVKFGAVKRIHIIDGLLKASASHR